MFVHSMSCHHLLKLLTAKRLRRDFVQVLLIAVFVTVLVESPVAAFTLRAGDVLVGRRFNSASSRDGDVIRLNVDDGTFEVLVSGGTVRSPNRITTDHEGRIIIAEGQNGPILAIEPDGAEQVIVGSGDLVRHPTGVAVGPDGFLYVSAGGFRDPDGRVVRLDMDGYNPLEPEANQEVVASGGLLNFPGGIVVGPSGDVFVGSLLHNKIVLVDPDTYNAEDEEANQTIVGSGLFPSSLALDGDGTVLVSFLNDQSINRIDPTNYDPVSPQANSTKVASIQDCGVCSLATEASGQILLLESDNFPYQHGIVEIHPTEYDSENPLANQIQLASIEDIPEGSILTGLWVVPVAVPEPNGVIAHLAALLSLGFIRVFLK